MVILEEVSSSVSCSSTPQWKYHVFLSFRGTDTRNNFTGHLYSALIQKGINAYMDDPELPKGEEISSELLQAIQDSKISIIVFSENYASSSWCLDELVKILDCKKSNKQMVHPIFYQVEPSDIRHLKGSFGEALSKHECRFKDNLEKVQEWKNALSEAANLSGWTLPITKNQSESKLIKEIVEKISKELISHTCLDVGKHSVGIERRVQAVHNLFSDDEGKHVRMVGIWGTGGIGKTTLAKSFYNSIAHQFEGCCFLENVRENSKCNRNLVKLQKKLLSGLLAVGTETLNFSNSAQGITMIKERLQYKSVLLILDDVSDIVQLGNLAGKSDWFGMGSRIIITTRDKKLLRAHDVRLVYEVDALNHHDSLELFSLCAFHEKTALDDYVEFTKRAIGCAQGLPLALTVLGSSLFKVEDKDIWEATLNGLKSDLDIQKILKVSYDALDAHVKEAFLDIACFLNGERKDYVMDILKGCPKYNPKYLIDVLTEKALIRIDPVYGLYDRIRMHDLLEEMGKDIVNQQSPNDPGERSRLWFHGDVYNVLTTENSGTRKIIGIKVELPQDSDEICLTVGTFSKMLNLRLFICRAGRFSGDLDYLPNSLRVVDWPNCPFPSLGSNFNPKNLSLLNLPESRITEIGKTWKNLTYLTSINLRGCEFLIKVSDLSGVPNVQHLDLSRCKSLVEVDHSVGRLDRLLSFNLNKCSRLTNFPTSVTWKSLTHLYLNRCTRLEIFIEFVNKMESIAKLDLSNTGIKELPAWIGYVTSLVELNLSGTLVKELPSSIGNLTSLEELNLSGTPVKELPSSIGNLTSLEELNLSGTPVKELPSSIGNLTSLAKLDLSETPVKELPSSIGNLTSLAKLDLSETPIKELPSSIENLTSLVELNLCRTPVKELPSLIGNLTSLAKLDLSETPVKELPSSIGNLTSLVELNCFGALVIEFPSSIGNLTSLVELNLTGTPVKELPSSIGNLTSLKELNLSRTLIKDLPLSIGNLLGLKRLCLQECENLANVPDSVYGGLQFLITLVLSWCPKLVTFPTNPDTCNSASSLFPQLTGLYFQGCNFVSVYDFLSNLDCTSTLLILDLSGSSFDILPACITKFRRLHSLDLSDCKWLRDITEPLQNTSIVDLHDCVAFERFSTFSNILEQRGNRLIPVMNLRGCYRLVENLGIEELVSKFENAFRNQVAFWNQLVDNGRMYVTFSILRGSEVPEWFDKLVLSENTYDTVIEIPPSSGLAVCLVYETDPNLIYNIRGSRTANGVIEIDGYVVKRNVPNETECSKDHDHVWLAWYPLRFSMPEHCVVRFSSDLLRDDDILIKSCGIHLINLSEDISIDDDYHYNEEEEEFKEVLSKFDCHNGEGAAAISLERFVDLRDWVALERCSTFSNILEQRGNRLIDEMDWSGCYRLVENLGIVELVWKFENVFRNRLVDNGRDIWKYSVKFPILRGSEVPEWFYKHVLPENTSEIVIEIPRSLNWEKTGLAVCIVYETDPNFFIRIEAMPRENGIDIRLIEKKNVANETEWSKDHDHVWLAWFPWLRPNKYEYRVRLYSELLRIKSWGVHPINLAAIFHTKRGLDECCTLG